MGELTCVRRGGCGGCGAAGWEEGYQWCNTTRGSGAAGADPKGEGGGPCCATLMALLVISRPCTAGPLRKNEAVCAAAAGNVVAGGRVHAGVTPWVLLPGWRQRVHCSAPLHGLLPLHILPRAGPWVVAVLQGNWLGAAGAAASPLAPLVPLGDTALLSTAASAEDVGVSCAVACSTAFVATDNGAAWACLLGTGMGLPRQDDLVRTQQQGSDDASLAIKNQHGTNQSLPAAAA